MRHAPVTAGGNLSMRFNKLTFNLGPVQLTEHEHQKLEEAVARARD